MDYVTAALLELHWLSITQTIDDFHKLFIDGVKVSKPLFYNAAEKSLIIIKFEIDVDNNTVVILYKKQQKS